MNNKFIITGVTGMVGEEVLHECLLREDIAEVLVISRKPCGIEHPKLREIIHADFFDLSAIREQLGGYRACLFCLGVSSVGMKEEEFFRLTHTLTLNFASALAELNPDMVFCYISGAGTDSSEKGRIMWARVKGKTENDLMKLPFRAVYNFRPGYLQPARGMKNTKQFYHYISWIYPLLKTIFPGGASTLKQLAFAMISVAMNGYEKHILEVRDIVRVAESGKEAS